MVLVVLRGAAVALLAMVLCEPVLTWWHQQVIRPLVLVLVDTSPSMRVTEGPVTRLQQAVAVLSDEGWSVRLQQAEVRAWDLPSLHIRLHSIRSRSQALAVRRPI